LSYSHHGAIVVQSVFLTGGLKWWLRETQRATRIPIVMISGLMVQRRPSGCEPSHWHIFEWMLY
jgi:hypothetical protein